MSEVNLTRKAISLLLTTRLSHNNQEKTEIKLNVNTAAVHIHCKIN